MKKIILSAMALMVSGLGFAQLNIQTHYDLGRPTNPQAEKDRQTVTTTVEYFGADKLGSTFFFIDLDYHKKALNKGMVSAYWEASRDFTFATLKQHPQHSFSAHAEYNGGANLYGPFQQALLLGPAWSWHSQNFKKTFTFQALYKQHLKSDMLEAMAGFQTTIVWGYTFVNDWLTFSGFADYWYGHRANDNKKGMTFLVEPQLWVNVLNKANTKQKLSIGTELELSNNFIWRTCPDRTFFFNPTLAVKWTL